MDSGDLHYCEAFPCDTNDSLLTNRASPSPKRGRFFNVNIKLTETKLVFNPKKDDFDCLNDKTAKYSFTNIPLAKMQEEITVVRMLSDIGVPEDAQYFMTSKIMTCAQNMAQCTDKRQKLLPMQVLIYITASLEGDTKMVEEDEEEPEEFAAEFKKEQLDNSSVPETLLDEQLERAKV